MTDFDVLEDQLKTDLGQFLLAIQTFRGADAATFQRIDRTAADLARVLKGQSLIPRSILWELRGATKILRAEAPYVNGGQNELVKMADKLEMTFDLILLGESPDDRAPGVPRII